MLYEKYQKVEPQSGTSLSGRLRKVHISTLRSHVLVASVEY